VKPEPGALRSERWGSEEWCRNPSTCDCFVPRRGLKLAGAFDFRWGPLGNRAYLVNTSWLTSDPSELERRGRETGHVYGEIASSNNRLLIPWFCCFRKGDLRSVQYDSIRLQLPCTKVEQAVRNMEQALPIFEAITRNRKIARAYWALSCTLLGRLPLPFLMMNPLEVLFSDDPAPLSAALVGSLSGDLSAVPHLKALSNYDDEVSPYPLDVLYSISGGQPDTTRMWNASVLDGGFQPDFHYVHWNVPHGEAEPTAPPPVPDSTFGELYDFKSLIDAQVKAAAPSAPGSELGIWPGDGHGREHLQVQINTRTDSDAKRLDASPDLRRYLDELARHRLEPWCKEYGFGWQGFLFQAPKWAKT
jgi:hypothetical protein